MKHSIDIYRNGEWVSGGKVDESNHLDCRVMLGGSFAESDRIYHAIEMAIHDGRKRARRGRDFYSWRIMPMSQDHISNRGPESKDAFTDFPTREPAPWVGRTHKCPKCHGHGGWNSELHAYPLRGREDTPANRHEYSHLKERCLNCEGYGWVPVEESGHIHYYMSVEETHEYEILICRTCGKAKEVDPWHQEPAGWVQ